MQIYDLAVRIIEGQGLPWPKPAYLKRLASQEKTRVLVLRLLEEKLGVREPGDMELATGDQIIAVVSGWVGFHLTIFDVGTYLMPASKYYWLVITDLKVLYHRQCQYTQANEYHFDGANSIETTNH